MGHGISDISIHLGHRAGDTGVTYRGAESYSFIVNPPSLSFPQPPRNRERRFGHHSFNHVTSATMNNINASVHNRSPNLHLQAQSVGPNVALSNQDLSAVMQNGDMLSQAMNTSGRGHGDGGFRGQYTNTLLGTPQMDVMTNAMGMNGSGASMNSVNSMGNMSSMANMASMPNMNSVGSMNAMNNMATISNLSNMNLNNNINNMSSMSNMNSVNSMSSMPNMANVNNINSAVAGSQQGQPQQQQAQPQQRHMSASNLHFSQNQPGAYMNNTAESLPQNSMSYVAPNNAQPHNDHATHPLEPTESKASATSSNMAFLNPFFGNSYPITNPPLFDSTMLLPFGDSTGTNRRRRISISNGQIGQIVNHEAFFMDEDLMEEFYEQSRQIRPHSPETPVSAGQGDSGSFARSQKHLMPVGANATDTQQFTDINDHMANLAMPAVKLEYASLVRNTLGVMEHDQPSSERVAGVPPPNHLLIYNNEIIYNPNDGPIPGTAAWKKERLLERNRVAASKCRQRKKHAQQQLQDNMNKAQNQVKEKEDLIQRYSSLLEVYNEALKRHFNGEQGVLESLRKHIDLPILEYNPDKAAISS